MAETGLNIGEARVTMPVDGCSPERAERIARLIFQHLQGILTRECRRPGAPRALAHLRVPSLEVAWDQMDEEAIARAGASWIYRWLRAGQ